MLTLKLILTDNGTFSFNFRETWPVPNRLSFWLLPTQ